MKVFLLILAILSALLILLALLRVGVLVSFGEKLVVKLRIGPCRLTVIPRKQKQKKKPAKPKPAEEKPAEEPPKKRRFPSLSIEEWLDLLSVAWPALGRTASRACRRTRIAPLDCTVIFADEDPTFAASMYGTANMLLFTLFPRLEETFRIPSPSIHLRVNFDGLQPSAFGRVGVSLRIIDLITIFLTLFIPLFKWYRRIQKAHAAETPSAAAAPENSESEQKSA